MSILTEYKTKLPKKLLDEIKEFTKGLSDTKVKKIVETTMEEYENAKIEPGESVEYRKTGKD